MLSLLRMRLHEAIVCQGRFREVEAAFPPTTQFERSRLDQTIQVIPIKRLHKAIPFVYVCAIAHHLATPSQSAASIAAHLVDRMMLSHSDAITSGVVIQATATGLIQFDVGDRAIAAWLDALLNKALPPLPFVSIATTEPSIVLPSLVLFDVQYAHARCCSLLRLAHSEGIMTLNGLDEAPLSWRVASPASLPWLTSTAQLCLDHPVDRHLLGHLVGARDCLSDTSSKRTQRMVRSAQAIAQAMQGFHRAHPFWRKTGHSARAEPNLVMAQLGLLLATQHILHLLLTEGLHLHPVVEL